MFEDKNKGVVFFRSIFNDLMMIMLKS